MVGNAQQRRAKRSRLRPSEYMFEPVLGHLPQTQTLPPFPPAFRGQSDVAPSAIRRALSQGNQSLAFKRPQIVTERGAIGRQSIREFRKCRWVRGPNGTLHED